MSGIQDQSSPERLHMLAASRQLCKCCAKVISLYATSCPGCGAPANGRYVFECQ